MNPKTVTAVVLRGEPEIQLPSSGTVPVTKDFDHQQVVGSARLARDDRGDVVATMTLYQDVTGTPAIGYWARPDLVGGEITEVGICKNANMDPSIGKI